MDGEMKFDIAWHNECLGNWKRSHKKMVEQLEIDKTRLEEDGKKIEFYEFQIREAVKSWKDGFDRDKFKKGVAP